MSLFLESSLHREGNECAFLIQISRPKLFNSAELICSHGGECLKVRADLMHLVRCSALLALVGDTSTFLMTHYSFQAIPANFDTHLRRLSAPCTYKNASINIEAKYGTDLRGNCPGAVTIDIQFI